MCPITVLQKLFEFLKLYCLCCVKLYFNITWKGFHVMANPFWFYSQQWTDMIVVCFVSDLHHAPTLSRETNGATLQNVTLETTAVTVILEQNNNFILRFVVNLSSVHFVVQWSIIFVIWLSTMNNAWYITYASILS